jgi:hypothetical protein
MQAYRNHLSVTIWIVLATLTLGLIIKLPERVFTLWAFGSPVDFRISGAFLAGLLALAATWAGLEAALRTHPRGELLRHTFQFWGLPSAITLAGAALLPTIDNQGLWLLTLGGVGAALAASMAGEYHTLDGEDPSYVKARWLLNVLDYALAALAFILIYLSRSRSLVSATLIGLTAGMLAMDLLRGSGARTRLIFLYSGLIALILAQFTILLNYWPYPSMQVALILLVGFYLMIGLAQWQLREALTRRRAAEYILMSALAILVIFLFASR